MATGTIDIFDTQSLPSVSPNGFHQRSRRTPLSRPYRDGDSLLSHSRGFHDRVRVVICTLPRPETSAVPKLLFYKRLVLALNPPAFTVRQLSQVETVLGKNELSNRGLLATADSLTGPAIWSGHAEPVCESMAGTEAHWVLVDRHRRRERLPED